MMKAVTYDSANFQEVSQKAFTGYQMYTIPFKESIKNNEDLKQKLKTAKEKAASGIAYAKESSSYAAERFKENANTLYEKNYHGQLAEGIGQAYTSAAQRATEVKKQIAMRNDPNYS